MIRAAAVLLLTLCVPVWGAQAPPMDAAKATADGVKGVFGTEDGLVTNGLRPFGSTDPMRTVDGTTFNAQLSCSASELFLRVTALPAGSDVGSITVEMDSNLDGTVETAMSFAGPFSGVCNNGVIRCNAGTWNDCHSFKWDTTDGTLALTEVPQSELGACYCFNASCGNNLLFVNSQKVVSDIGTSVLTSAQKILPRVTSSRTVADALSVQFLGQKTSCGVDQSPEQYFSRPADLTAAGATAAAEPGTVANFITNTSFASNAGTSRMSCRITRNVQAESYTLDEILHVLRLTRGSTASCGPGCLQITLGQVGDNYYRGAPSGRGGRPCSIFEETLQLEVAHPDRLTDARLIYAEWDDAVQLQVNRNVVFSSHVAWGTGPWPSYSCETGGNGRRNPGTSLMAQLSAGGVVEVLGRAAVDDDGEAWQIMELRVDESCRVLPDEVVDSCTAVASNTRCALVNEKVDGVQTVRNGLTTGLGPLPSSHPVGPNCPADAGTRPWWLTEREYECKDSTPPYDGQAAAERYKSIHSTIDLGTGAFTDRRVNANGAVVLESVGIPVVSETSSGSCTPTCRTRKPRPGANVGVSGPTTVLNTTGVAYDFTYKECDSANMCPLDAGEEVVNACDCRSNFAAAAALMQTIRMVAEDSSCEVAP